MNQEFDNLFPKITSEMTPDQLQIVMDVLISRVNKSTVPSNLPISPQAQEIRDYIITASLETENPNRIKYPRQGIHEIRDITIFKQRCGIYQPPMTQKDIGLLQNMTPQNARIRFETISRRILNPLKPFIPLEEDHLARQAWDATCGYDVLNIIDPEINQKIISESPINNSTWNNPQKLDQVPTRISQSLDTETKSNLISILNHLFPR